MSFNESVRTREPSSRVSESASSRTETGLARLRQRLSGSQSLDGEGAGLGDPFAEIFARIATSDAPPPVEAPTDQPVHTESNVEETERTDDESSRGNEVSENAKAETTVAQPNHVIVETAEQKTLEQEDEAEVVNDSTPVVTDEQAQESLRRERDEKAELVANSDSEVEADTMVTAGEVEVEDEFVADESVIDAEVAISATKTKERRQTESDEVIAVDNTVETEVSEASVRVDQPAEKQAADDSENDRRNPRQPEVQTTETNRNVDRRRYSEEKGSSNQPSGDESQAAGESADASSVRPDSQRNPNPSAASISARASSGGMDVSGMTPVASVSPIAATAVAAASNLSSVGPGSVAAAATKANAAASVSTLNSTTNANVDGAEPTPTLESSNKPNLADASAKSGSGNAVAGTDTLSAVQRAKLVQRVSRGFQHLGPNGGQIRMRLSPDALGAVQLQLNIRGGELSGTMVTQTEAASQALREQLPQLRSSLESQGIRMDHIDVRTESASSTMDPETSGQRFGDPSGQPGNQSFGQAAMANQRSRSSWAEVRATPRPEVAAQPVGTWSTNSSGVDLQV